MTRVALNGRFTGIEQPTGTQTAAFHLFDRIVRENRSHDLVVFADPRFPGVAAWRDQPRVTLVETPLRDRSRNFAHVWEQTVLPRLCRRHGCVVAHHPITTSPAWKLGVRSLVTLHDLSFHLHPEWYARSFRLAYALFAMPGLRRADRVVTVSDYVRGLAHQHLGLPAHRLRTIHNGAKPLAPGRAGGPGGAPYVLCVGASPPHKNLVRVLEAFALLRTQHPALELHLVGRPHPRMGAEDPALAPLLAAPGVRVLGYLDEPALSDAYAGAAVYCCPSLEEGFGLPILEAMSLGVPVVTSSTSCLPEIAGGAAILVDPRSVRAIADGLRHALLLTPEQRREVGARGRAQAARFSWTDAARAYLELYDELGRG